MRVIPFGKNEGYVDRILEAALDELRPEPEEVQEPEAVEPTSDEMLNADQQSKAQRMEEAIAEILGEPSLDSLMIILTAIGMSKISLSMAEDQAHLSVAGIISLSEDKKIKKE